MADQTIECRCCRVPVFGMRQRFRVCPICDMCNERHGHALHVEIVNRALAHAIDPYLAIAVSAFDDAWLCGKMEIDGVTGLRHSRECPKRWEVAIAWARTAKQPVNLQGILEAVLAPFMGRPNIPSVRDEIAREMRMALCTADPNLIDIEITSMGTGPNVEADEIQIKATAKTAAPPLAHNVGGGPEVELPADIWSRPREQA